MVQASIIVPVFQSPAILSPFLESLLDTIAPGTEVIFVDDGSPSASAALLELAVIELQATGCSATLISHGRSRGCGQSLNEALRHATGDIVIFADSDLILQRGWQTALMSSTYAISPSTGRESGMAGALLLYPQTGGIQHSGLRFSSTRARHWRLNSRREWLDSETVEVQAAAFALFAAHRAVLEDVGGLDERYVNGYEDLDFQMRARQHGWRTSIDLTHASYHWEQSNGPGRSTNRTSNLAMFWGTWGHAIENDLVPNVARTVRRVVEGCEHSEVIDLLENRVDAGQVRGALADGHADVNWMDLSHLVDENRPLEMLSFRKSIPASPAVFLVENIVRVLGNALWASHRQDAGIEDVVVDLYGNVVSTRQLIDSFWPGTKVR